MKQFTKYTQLPTVPGSTPVSQPEKSLSGKIWIALFPVLKTPGVLTPPFEDTIAIIAAYAIANSTAEPALQ